MQHPDKHTYKLCLKKQMKHLEQTFATYVYSHCNICNILIYFCNIHMNTCNIPLKHLKHLKHMLATCAFSAISPCCFGMEASRRVEFTSVELADGAELAAPMEKVAAGAVEKATVRPRAREAHSWRETRWRGRKMGCHALARRRCWPAERRRDGDGGTVEREA